MTIVKFADLTFLCNITAPGSLSAYKGSMFRGALGVAMRKTCCTMHRSDCTGCIIEHVCPFPKLFLAKAHEGTAQGRPTVYCIEPEQSADTLCTTKNSLTFTVKLFSYGADYAPYFVQAILMAGKQGVGRRTDEGQARYRITGILAGGRNIYDVEHERLLGYKPSELCFPTWKEDDNMEGEVTVDFLTPCRFKRGNRFSSALPFGELMLLILRRIRGLAILEGNKYRLEEFSAFMSAASAVETVSEQLIWKDWRRWSNRQNDSMQFGGLVGRSVFRGRLTSFIPFLKMAECIHIGKQTSFGLGKIKVSVSV